MKSVFPGEAVSAQSSENPITCGPAGVVLPLADRPLSLQQVEERTYTARNGDVISEPLVSRIYRDSAGRTRFEWRMPGGNNGQPTEIVYLLDPVSCFAVILCPDAKAAWRVTLPKSDAGEFQVGLPGVGRSLPEGNWESMAQELGSGLIENVEVDGTRTVRISKDHPGLSAREEVWFSRRLGLTLTIAASGPNWMHTVALRNLEFHEPDPGAFAIPPDYEIQDD